jgi:hypothetical protein
MSKLEWDSWGLPVKENGYQGESCKDLAIFFINVYCYKKYFDHKFKQDYPQRPRNFNEGIEEYNVYLTQHLHAYRDLLSKQKAEYTQDSDVHFHDKLNGLLYNDNICTHPQLGRSIDNLNLVPMLACLKLFGFDTVVSENNIPMMYRQIMKGRISKLKTFFMDAVLLLSVAMKNNPEMQIPQMLVSKEYNPSWLSKLTQRLYFTKYRYYGNIQDTTIEYLLT